MEDDKIPLIVKIAMVAIVCIMIFITWWYGTGIWVAIDRLNIKL